MSSDLLAIRILYTEIKLNKEEIPKTILFVFFAIQQKVLKGNNKSISK